MNSGLVLAEGAIDDVGFSIIDFNPVFIFRKRTVSGGYNGRRNTSKNITNVLGKLELTSAKESR